MRFLGIQSGKSIAAEAMLNTALNAGHKVLVIRSGSRAVYHRDPRSGFTVITPVPDPAPRQIFYDDAQSWITKRFLSESRDIPIVRWTDWNLRKDS